MERLEVLQQKLEHWCAASVRALSGQPTVHYRGHNLYLGEKHLALRAPYLHLDFSTHNAHQLRGVADAIALRLFYSDDVLHSSKSPESPLQQLVFELLEQLRTEALVPDKFVGMRKNLRNRFIFWATQASTSKLVENDIGLLIFALIVMAWSRLLSESIPEHIEDVIESTRWGLAESIGSQLRELKRIKHEQQAFAATALLVAKTISDMANEQSSNGEDQEDAAAQLQKLADSKQLNLKWLENDSEQVQNQFGIMAPNALESIPDGFVYQVFTKEHDRELAVTQLIRTAQLRKFRLQLDKRIRQQSLNTHRVARYIKQLVASPTLSGWSFGQEQGYLDAARLTRLVTSPEERRLFRREDQRSESDCAISILIDNSGSMNHHNETVAALADNLAKALELASVRCEVLGFTTREWNGGQVTKDWLAAGSPDNPGRLNAIQHTVYKEFETPWRRSRPAIAGLLRTDLFRESVDGEALEWASQRLALRPESKKILIVISDGSPMDTATVSANHERYLDHHLAQVCRNIERRPDLKLCAIGVGLDLSAYYQHSMSITLDNELTTNDYLAMAELLHRAT